MKLTISFVLTIFTVFSAMAMNDGITVSDVNISDQNGSVNINFNANISKRAARAGYTLMTTPVFENGDQTVTLPAIVVQRRKAKNASERNNNIISESSVYAYANNGETVNYNVSIPNVNLTPDAKVVMHGVNIGCCSEKEVEPVTIAENFVSVQKIQEEKVTYVQEPVRVFTTAEKLAEKLPFILSAADFDVVRGMSADKFIDDNRNQSIVVYYPLGTNKLTPSFRNNSAALKELIDAIMTIERSNDSRVVRVVIAGFASPEGSKDLNNKLAMGRAVAMRDYITSNTSLGNDCINIHNGGIDWKGLRDLTATSNIESKQSVLSVLDNVPVWDAKTQKGRLGELMKIDGGNAYRYLSDNIFPELRCAAYIKVYYENK